MKEGVNCPYSGFPSSTHVDAHMASFRQHEVTVVLGIDSVGISLPVSLIHKIEVPWKKAARWMFIGHIHTSSCAGSIRHMETTCISSSRTALYDVGD